MARRQWLTLGIVLTGALLTLSCITPCLSIPGGRLSRGEPAATATPLNATECEAAIKRVDEKAMAFDNDTFTVEFTGLELTCYAAQNLGPSAPLASPKITFQPGAVTVEGDLTGPIRGHVSVSGTIQAVAGKPQITFEAASIAGVLIPGGWLTSVSDSISEMLLQSKANVVIDTIDVQAGRIVITGHQRHP
ncbi:MAG TPA: hypothetical protein PLJ35_08700 [Anaerolineae bacterium]|nr:hypothetical protein [Anaerolineae bacterium]HOQ98887.1 hypothetical protein [Anaerolineae bacterium]HPL27402.1 hypothetical protein [Anaerolineae bacterium]